MITKMIYNRRERKRKSTRSTLGMIVEMSKKRERREDEKSKGNIAWALSHLTTGEKTSKLIGTKDESENASS